MQVEYKIIVDMARPSKKSSLLVMQGDTNTRVLRFILKANGEDFDMSDAIEAYVTAITPEGSTIVDSAQCQIVKREDASGNQVNTNEILYTLPAQITNTSGRVAMTITIQGDSKIITSFEFYVDTRNELFNTNNAAQQDDLSGFRDILNQAIAAVDKVEKLSQKKYFPNENPIVLDIGDNSYSYNGEEKVTIVLDEVPYIGTVYKEVDDITLPDTETTT